MTITTISQNATYNAFPAACICRDGTFLAAGYEAGTAAETNSSIYAYRSTNKGLTWSATLINQESGKDSRVYLGMSQISNGRVFLPYSVDQTGSGSSFINYLKYSDDAGATWSSPVTVANPFSDFIVLYGTIRETANGRLYMPAYGQPSGGPIRSILLESTDQGANWVINGTIWLDGVNTISEADVWCFDNDNFMAVIRRNEPTPRLYVATSSNRGGDWTASPALIGDGVSPALIGVPSLGGVMLLYGKRSSSPYGISFLVTRDSGSSWGSGGSVYSVNSISNVANVGYPAPATYDPNTLFVAFYYEDSRGAGNTTTAWSPLGVGNIGPPFSAKGSGGVIKTQQLGPTRIKV